MTDDADKTAHSGGTTTQADGDEAYCSACGRSFSIEVRSARTMVLG
jgi:hypothetical protein